METKIVRLDGKMPEIKTLCIKHNVGNLFVFGSVLTDRFSPTSDVDFVVNFNDMPVEDYADNYFSLKAGLQDAVGRPVDLVEEKSITNPYFRRSVEATKQQIYG